jgi:hypothetical protein
VTIGENDFDTLLPDDDDQESVPWQPAICDPIQFENKFSPGRVMSCFRAAGSLGQSFKFFYLVFFTDYL